MRILKYTVIMEKRAASADISRVRFGFMQKHMANDEIRKLYIEPTSACNLHCSMCFRHNWFDETVGSMSAAVVREVLELPTLLPSLESVMFSGMGEPLLHPALSTMIRAFAAQGIKTELLTNGTLLTAEKSAELLDSGLSGLWMSVDGFNRESYEKVHIGSQFDLISEHLATFDSLRGDCKLGFTFVITAESIGQLPKLNAFADRYHADAINLSYAVPCAPVTEENACYDAGYRIGKQERSDMQTSWKRQRDLCPFVSEGGCFLKWNGDVCPCMQLLHSSYSYFFEEKRKIIGKSYGNLTQCGLQEIWNSSDYAQFRQRVRDFEFSDCTICMGCEDRLENRTDCMYNPFPTCGACLWAQGIGRCP